MDQKLSQWRSYIWSTVSSFALYALVISHTLWSQTVHWISDSLPESTTTFLLSFTLFLSFSHPDPCSDHQWWLLCPWSSLPVTLSLSLSLSLSPSSFTICPCQWNTMKGYQQLHPIYTLTQMRLFVLCPILVSTRMSFLSFSLFFLLPFYFVCVYCILGGTYNMQSVSQSVIRCVCVCLFASANFCICVCMCICMCMCICVYWLDACDRIFPNAAEFYCYYYCLWLCLLLLPFYCYTVRTVQECSNCNSSHWLNCLSLFFFLSLSSSLLLVPFAFLFTLVFFLFFPMCVTGEKDSLGITDEEIQDIFFFFFSFFFLFSLFYSFSLFLLAHCIAQYGECEKAKRRKEQESKSYILKGQCFLSFTIAALALPFLFPLVLLFKSLSRLFVHISSFKLFYSQVKTVNFSVESFIPHGLRFF